MEIIIPLPNPTSSFDDRTYGGVKSYLKQLELAVHHAQKSIEQFEKDGVEITEDSFMHFKFPGLKPGLKEIDVIKDEDVIDQLELEDLQLVELRIVIE